MEKLSFLKPVAMDPFQGGVQKSAWGRGKELFRLGPIPTSPKKYQGPGEPSLGLGTGGPCSEGVLKLQEQTSPAERIWRERGEGFSADAWEAVTFEGWEKKRDLEDPDRTAR